MVAGSISRRSDQKRSVPRRRFSLTMAASAIIFPKDNPMSDAMAAAQCIDDLKEGGIDYDQARILVEFIVRSQEHLATKQDIKALEVRIDGLEARIDRLEARIDGLEAKIDRLDARIDGVEAKIDRLDARIDGVEAKIDRLDARIDGVEAKIDRLDARIDGVEAKIDRLDARIDGVEARIDGVDVKIGSLAVDMKAFEARFARQLYVFGFGIIGSMMAMMGLFVALQMPG